jgi:hypothetical protein
MHDRKQSHGRWAGVGQVLLHIAVTPLAVVIAFSLPTLASYILYEWWPRVEANPNLLLATEIALASALVLTFNYARIAWDDRRKVNLVNLASLVHARIPGAGWASRWRDRIVVRELPAARDVFVMATTGHDVFVSKDSLLRDVPERTYEIRVMLVNPVGEGLRRRVESMPADTTLLAFHREIEATVARLADLRKLGKKVTLKFCEEDPLWNLVVLGDYVWVRHCESKVEVRQQPEYVFALLHHNPTQGLYMPFYMHFLNRWNEPRHPEFDFETSELIYRDGSGNESGRASLEVPINGLPLRTNNATT